MSKKITNQHHQTFESIRQQTEDGRDYWSARDLRPILEYSRWDKFTAVIRKAISACDNSGIQSADHFPRVGKMVAIGSGAERHIPNYDYHLSRYACYLIVQNGDPSKPVIANGQTYFALQTRRQELVDDLAFQQLDEGFDRLSHLPRLRSLSSHRSLSLSKGRHLSRPSSLSLSKGSVIRDFRITAKDDEHLNNDSAIKQHLITAARCENWHNRLPSSKRSHSA